MMKKWIGLGMLLIALSSVTHAAPVELSVSNSSIRLGEGVAPFQKWNLEKYRQTHEKNADFVELGQVTQIPAAEQVSLAFDSSDYLYLEKVNGTFSRQGDSVIWTYEDGAIKIVRTIRSAQDQPYLGLTYDVEFKTPPKAKTVYIGVRSASHKDDQEKVDQQLLHFADKEIHRTPTGDIDPAKGGKKIAGPLKWVATQSRYFILAAVPQSPVSEGYLTPIANKAGVLSLSFPVTGNKVSVSLKVYFGPKELEKLRSVEPTLDHAVDFGWFTILAYPLLQLMRWLYGFVHNYGIAIILMTILVKLLTMPLNYKAAAGMAKMSKLQPQIKKLQDKYKDDKMRLNQEMMTLMRGSGANPMAGCFPILIQMPVFFALYRVLYSAVELYQAPFMGWIHDLSMKDPFYVTPILLTATMFIQQKLTPTPATVDPAQAKMMQLMPVIFGVMMLWLPSGLTLYMLTNAVVSIFQQRIINKKLGIIPGGGTAVPAAT